MKAKRFILLAALLPLLAVSCVKVGPEGPMGLPGPMGPQGPQGPAGEGAGFKTVIVSVPQESWVISDYKDNNYFTAKIQMPEITKDIFKFGDVSVYRTYNFESNDPSQQILPFTRHHEEIDGDQTFFYTETIDYEYGVGWLRIYYTLSDFFYELDLGFVPDPMEFRVVLNYPE